MQIPRSYIEAYSAALNGVANQGKEALAKALEQVDYSRPVVEVRAEVVAIMQQACGASSTVAARLAADFYDGLRDRFGIGDGFFAEVDSGRDPNATEGAVRAFADSLCGEPDVDKFKGKCIERLDSETRNAANKCVFRNVKQDPRKPKWARVPIGAGTCDFCIMLAGRGFVYHSDEMATHSHPNCDCRVIPSWDKEGASVEGYYPKEYYDIWKHPGSYKGLDETTKMSLAACRVAQENGLAIYKKPLGSFLATDEGKRDLFAHAALAHGGIAYTALSEDSPEGYSNIDLLIDGDKWEVKSPDGDNPRAVETRLRRAKDQFEKNYPKPIEMVRVIFNGRFYGKSDDWTMQKIEFEKAHHGISEVMFVGKDGNIR